MIICMLAPKICSFIVSKNTKAAPCRINVTMWVVLTGILGFKLGPEIEQRASGLQCVKVYNLSPYTKPNLKIETQFYIQATNYSPYHPLNPLQRRGP